MRQIQTLDALTNGKMLFDANETMQVLKHKPIWLMSWAARGFTNYKSNGANVLYFRVSGHHHKGYVMITLAYDDTYTVDLVSMKWQVKKTFTMVYFDMLAELIDNHVERVKEYTS